MMEAAPSAPFIVTKPDLLLDFLVVTPNAPAQFGGVDQIPERDVLRQSREPIFGWLIFALRPLDQQPLLRLLGRTLVLRCNMHPHPGKSRGQQLIRAFAPSNRAPCFRAQSQRDILDRDRIGSVAAPLLGGP